MSWNDNFGSAQTGLQKNCLKPTSNIPVYQKGTHDSVDMHLWLHIRACWPPGSLSSYSQVCFETTFSSLLSLCFGLSQIPLDSFSFLSYLQYKSSLLTMERPFQEFLHCTLACKHQAQTLLFPCFFSCFPELLVAISFFLYGFLVLKPHTGQVLKNKGEKRVNKR